jgi:hypothetical protein
MKSFIPLYDKEFAPYLNPLVDFKKQKLTKNLCQRSEGFKQIFNLLEEKNNSSYFIVETGTLRHPGNWLSGQSSILFEQFVKTHGGKVESIDISVKACNAAKSILDANFTKINLGDSIKFLLNGNWNTVDLFYLDSYDVEWEKPLPSAEHHLKEFLAIEKYMKSGVILAIDDNSFLFNENQRTGKGMLIYEYLKNKNILPVYDDYQIIYKF